MMSMSELSTNRAQGQSLAEIALVLPVLLLVLLGAIDLGRLYYANETITNASREGARLGIAKPAQTSEQITAIKTRVIAEAAGSRITLQPADISIDCAPYGSTAFSASYCPSADIKPGDQIRVRVSVQFTILTTSLLGRPTIPLSKFTIMGITNAKEY